MIPVDLIELLRCPQTGQLLTLCPPDMVAEINRRIIAHGGSTVRTHTGMLVDDAIDGGIIRADGSALYPLRGGIPVLLIEEAIDLPLA